MNAFSKGGQITAVMARESTNGRLPKSRAEREAHERRGIADRVASPSKLWDARVHVRCR